MPNTTYQVEFLQENKYRLFRGLYNDFVSKSLTDYHFELPPLAYDEFVEAVSKDVIKCVVLLENSFPTAFMVYVVPDYESVELNLIHCLGDEDLIEKRNYLMKFFIENTETERKDAVVCYPMLGSQSDYTPDITHFDFKLIGLIVLRFLINDSASLSILKEINPKKLASEYKLVAWDKKYMQDAISVIHQTFQNTSDALFDNRFQSVDGVTDIIDKLTNSVYGEFLEDETTVLLYNNKPVGFAMANVTGNNIANIPLVGLLEEHRGTGLSVLMLKRVMDSILKLVKSKKREFIEVNVTTETDNFGALRMYRTAGFKEDYSYTQAYLPK